MNRKQIKRLRGNIRKISSQIVRDEFLRLNKKIIIGKDKAGRVRKLLHYTCNSCGELKRPYEIEVDHIKEVGEFKVEGKLKNTIYGDCKVVNWQEWMDRLFCSLDNFQVLCIKCHQRKTLGFSKYLRYDGELL